MQRRQRLLIVGGGISGLAAAEGAHAAANDRRSQLDIRVLEAGPRVGGKAQSLRDGPWLMECGPSSFLANEPVVDRLIAVAGVTPLRAASHAARRYVLRGAELREIHAHPLKFARSGLLSARGLVRLLAERYVPRAPADAADESVWSFAKRRLGIEVADRMMGPMVSGIFAGDAKQISLRAAFPRMAALEREHGSLLRALKARKQAGRLSGGPTGPAGHLTSFAEGMATLPLALAETGHGTVHVRSPVATIARGTSAAWRVVLEQGEAVEADGLVLATECWAARDMIATLIPQLAKPLDEIATPPVAVVALGFGQEALACCPKGFGALLPRDAGYRILGVLWETHMFPGRSTPDTLLVRVMLGGATDPDVGAMDPAQLLAIARSDTMRLLGLPHPPRYERIHLWPRAIPQYTLGHETRRQRVHAALRHARAELGPLAMAGNSLEGVSFGASAASGWRAGERIAQSLLQPIA